MKILHQVVETVEGLEFLDKIAEPYAAVVGKVVKPRFLRNLLSGTYVGHPLHPVLTDLPIGAWSMAALLDIVGSEATEPAADLLVVAGIVLAVPTAASGANDWSDTQGKERRLGLVHALANSTAVSLYTASLIARKRGNRGVGKALGLAGFGVLMAGGYLGGHLAYSKGVNVNRTAWREGPAEWQAVLAEAELAEGNLRKVELDGVSVVLYRDGGQIHALDSVCSHMGGPLEEGTVSEGCVTCPWHGSTFRLSDGGIVRGPASNPQPVYEARVTDGGIEVRRSPDS
ncbi:Rieske 2Fe-2S domain-containing protein [Arthrobacter sp. VKM Ac-2550]|uniref:Rieske 2Fe-2S domain-containing protein n=1 Tax=Crystallibacter permensis TaxID=1938888 RepID=UPI002226216E|nr:Rieske 2Fe-2S domain-containing protein [Arthrobacter sp. VKM Ac-2550]MCW2132062.1 Ferredoxin subunit of nitrite reductase or a ring-hydroxylating dioxygenase [Arthrobacter sp. VKM Ac-2550]